jgi:hypothetical protein
LGLSLMRLSAFPDEQFFAIAKRQTIKDPAERPRCGAAVREERRRMLPTLKADVDS